MAGTAHRRQALNCIDQEGTPTTIGSSIYFLSLSAPASHLVGFIEQWCRLDPLLGISQLQADLLLMTHKSNVYVIGCMCACVTQCLFYISSELDLRKPKLRGLSQVLSIVACSVKITGIYILFIKGWIH